MKRFILLSLLCIQVAVSAPVSHFNFKGEWALLTVKPQAQPLPTTLRLAVANTLRLRMKGLQQVKALPKNTGMFFIFPEEKIETMWMQHTPLSLDMVFMDGKGKVVHIAKNTNPMSTKTISSEKPVKALFEVAAGTADRLGLKIGQQITSKSWLDRFEAK